MTHARTHGDIAIGSWKHRLVDQDRLLPERRRHARAMAAAASHIIIDLKRRSVGLYIARTPHIITPYLRVGLVPGRGSLRYIDKSRQK